MSFVAISSSLVVLFQGNVVCRNCTLTELDLPAFLDGNGQLSEEATFCSQELVMKKEPLLTG